MTEVTQETNPEQLPRPGNPSNHGLEFRHLRYLVAVADAGTFTHAAERMFIAQPTLSQQIRRLEEMVGTPLLHRRRDGVELTAAGSVLLQESRTMLSLLEHGVLRSRQAAGLGRPRLRFVLPSNLPERLAVAMSSRLRSAAAAAGVDVEWLEAPLDAEFTPIRERRAGLADVTAGDSAGTARRHDNRGLRARGVDTRGGRNGPRPAADQHCRAGRHGRDSRPAPL